MKKERYLIEKETITKEVNGEKMTKKTYRVLVISEGKQRSLLFTKDQFKKFRDNLNKVLID